MSELSQSKKSWVALKAIMRREVVRFFRVWSQTILPSVITMSLYFIIFGGLIGGRIGDMHGFSYALFITPGLVMLAVITNAYINVSSSFYFSKFVKNIEEILISPVPNSLIILGYVVGGIVRGLVVGMVVIAVSLFFTHLHIKHVLIMILVIILSATLFSLAGLINAIYAEKFDDIALVPTFVLTPLTYLGGVFYSVSLLPDFWQHVSKYNPILYMVSVFRFGMIGYTDVSVVFALSMIVGFVVLFYVWCYYLLKKGTGLKS